MPFPLCFPLKGTGEDGEDSARSRLSIPTWASTRWTPKEVGTASCSSCTLKLPLCQGVLGLGLGKESQRELCGEAPLCLHPSAVTRPVRQHGSSESSDTLGLITAFPLNGSVACGCRCTGSLVLSSAV